VRKTVNRTFIIPCLAGLFAIFSTVAAGLAFVSTYLIYILELKELPNFQSISVSCATPTGSLACWMSRGILAVVPAIACTAVFLATWTLFHCPHCHKTLLVKTERGQHEEFQTLAPLNAFWTIMIDVLLYRKFSCFKCGGRCKLGQLSSSDS
jgi:hypothetical protein